MKTALAVLVLLLVAGCGSSSSDKPEGKASAKSPTPAMATLAETCPKVPPLLPDDTTATTRDWTTFRSALSALYVAGNADVRATLKPLDEAAARYEGGPAQGQEYGEAFDAWTGALKILNERCGLS